MKKLRIPLASSILLGALIFQVSIISDALGIKMIGRGVNALILLALASLLIRTINQKRPARVVLLYVLPIVFIMLGYALNMLTSLEFESFGTAYIFLPWLAALSIPFLASSNVETYWKIFYRFMLVTIVISVMEYFAVFSGFLTPTVIETDRGVFLKGVISIFTRLDSGLPHYRFFGVFAEPGTAAMFLIPAMTYALLFNKRLALIVFGVALYLTDSLGGYFALFVVIALYVFWKLGELHWSFSVKLILVGMIVAVAAASTIGFFVKRYEEKQQSAYVREDNVTEFIKGFGSSLSDHPLGFKLQEKSLSKLDADQDYYGSNLMFYVAFVQGGVLAFLGYLIFFISALIFSIKYFVLRHNPDRNLACVFISLPALLTYVFQRTTIFESIVFAFLFAAPLLEMMRAGSAARGAVGSEAMAE